MLNPGDRIPARIEEELEHSRVLPLAHRMGEGARRAGEGLSANALGSDWAQLEAGTCGRRNLRFRDPLNQERRFIPLRLDDDRIKGGVRNGAVASPAALDLGKTPTFTQRKDL